MAISAAAPAAPGTKIFFIFTLHYAG